MDEQLTITEKRYLDEFLKSVTETKLSPIFSYLYSGVISFFGLILFTAAVIITVQNLTDRVVYWVLIPGVIGGIGTIVFGLILLEYLRKSEEKKKMAAIIKKLLQ
ncbi:MAG: hypothetical protein HOC71_03515 [Candidatus Latescibacteria bacterium]|nr:hypothetical protein [Candidatus Latescibacterota bacterium]